MGIGVGTLRSRVDFRRSVVDFSEFSSSFVGMQDSPSKVEKSLS